MLGLAVRECQLDIIKYLVTECSVSVVWARTQVFTLSRNHLLLTDPTLSRQILKLSVDRSDLDFIKYIINNLRVGVNGELNDIHYLFMLTHTNKYFVQIVDVLIIQSVPT